MFLCTANVSPFEAILVAYMRSVFVFLGLLLWLIGSVQLTASTKTDRDLREDRDGRKSGRQETADATHG
jgi:hypothetical protein